MAIDTKYGKVTTECACLTDDEPVVVLRGKDALLIDLLDHYAELSRKAGSPDHHLEWIAHTQDTIEKWQETHPTEVPQSRAWKHPLDDTTPTSTTDTQE